MLTSNSDSTKANATMNKEIKYDRASRDYAMYLNGELVGYASTYHDAEVELDYIASAIIKAVA